MLEVRPTARLPIDCCHHLKLPRSAILSSRHHLLTMRLVFRRSDQPTVVSLSRPALNLPLLSQSPHRTAVMRRAGHRNEDDVCALGERSDES